MTSNMDTELYSQRWHVPAMPKETNIKSKTFWLDQEKQSTKQKPVFLGKVLVRNCSPLNASVYPGWGKKTYLNCQR